MPRYGITIDELQKKNLGEKIAKGEATPVEKYEYSNLRFMGKEIGYEHLLIALVILKLSKTPQGLKVIQTLGKEVIKGAFDTLHSLGQASAANKVAAWANPYLIAMVLDRFGFINPDYLLEYKVGLSIIAGAEVAEGFIDSISAILPFTKPEPSEYPTNIVFSARQAGVEVPEEISWSELSELMRTYPKVAPPKKKK